MNRQLLFIVFELTTLLCTVPAKIYPRKLRILIPHKQLKRLHSQDENFEFTTAIEEQARLLPIHQFQGDPELFQVVDHLNSKTFYTLSNTFDGKAVYERSMSDLRKDVIVLSKFDDNIIRGTKQKQKYVVLKKNPAAIVSSYYVTFVYIRNSTETDTEGISIGGNKYTLEWDTWKNHNSNVSFSSWTDCTSTVLISCSFNLTTMERIESISKIETSKKAKEFEHIQQSISKDSLLTIPEHGEEINDLYEDTEINNKIQELQPAGSSEKQITTHGTYLSNTKGSIFIPDAGTNGRFILSSNSISIPGDLYPYIDGSRAAFVPKNTMTLTLAMQNLSSAAGTFYSSDDQNVGIQGVLKSGSQDALPILKPTKPGLSGIFVVKISSDNQDSNLPPKNLNINTRSMKEINHTDQYAITLTPRSPNYSMSMFNSNIDNNNLNERDEQNHSQTIIQNNVIVINENKNNQINHSDQNQNSNLNNQVFTNQTSNRNQQITTNQISNPNNQIIANKMNNQNDQIIANQTIKQNHQITANQISNPNNQIILNQINNQNDHITANQTIKQNHQITANQTSNQPNLQTTVIVNQTSNQSNQTTANPIGNQTDQIVGNSTSNQNDNINNILTQNDQINAEQTSNQTDQFIVNQTSNQNDKISSNQVMQTQTNNYAKTKTNINTTANDIRGMYYTLGNGKQQIFIPESPGTPGSFQQTRNPSSPIVRGYLFPSTSEYSEMFIPENQQLLAGVLRRDQYLEGIIVLDEANGNGVYGRLLPSSLKMQYEFNPTRKGTFGLMKNQSTNQGGAEVTDISLYSGWKMQFRSPTPNITLQQESVIFFGLGNCPFKNVLPQDLYKAQSEAEIIEFYTTLLRTNCITEQTKYIRQLISDGFLEVKDKLFQIPTNNKYVLQPKLTQKQLDELSSAFEFNVFTETFAKEVNRTNSSGTWNSTYGTVVSKSTQFLVNMGLNIIQKSREKVKQHFVRLSRNLLKTINTGFKKLVEDFEVLRDCIGCELDRSINYNDRVQLKTFTEFIKHGMDSVENNYDIVQNSYANYFKTHADSIKNKIMSNSVH